MYAQIIFSGIIMKMMGGDRLEAKGAGKGVDNNSTYHCPVVFQHLLTQVLEVGVGVLGHCRSKHGGREACDGKAPLSVVPPKVIGIGNGQAAGVLIDHQQLLMAQPMVSCAHHHGSQQRGDGFPSRSAAMEQKRFERDRGAISG